MISNVALPLREVKKRFSEIVRDAEDKDKITIVLKRNEPSSAVISFKMLRKLVGDDAIKDLLFEVFVVNEAEKRIKDVVEGKNVVSEKEAKKRLGWK
jgi:prevent-host-death family protein